MPFEQVSTKALAAGYARIAERVGKQGDPRLSGIADAIAKELAARGAPVGPPSSSSGPMGLKIGQFQPENFPIIGGLFPPQEPQPPVPMQGLQPPMGPEGPMGPMGPQGPMRRGVPPMGPMGPMPGPQAQGPQLGGELPPMPGGMPPPAPDGGIPRGWRPGVAPPSGAPGDAPGMPALDFLRGLFPQAKTGMGAAGRTVGSVTAAPSEDDLDTPLGMPPHVPQFTMRPRPEFEGPAAPPQGVPAPQQAAQIPGPMSREGGAPGAPMPLLPEGYPPNGGPAPGPGGGGGGDPWGMLQEIGLRMMAASDPRPGALTPSSTLGAIGQSGLGMLEGQRTKEAGQAEDDFKRKQHEDELEVKKEKNRIEREKNAITRLMRRTGAFTEASVQRAQFYLKEGIAETPEEAVRLSKEPDRRKRVAQIVSAIVNSGTMIGKTMPDIYAMAERLDGQSGIAPRPADAAQDAMDRTLGRAP